MAVKPEEVRSNVETVQKQAYTFGKLNRTNIAFAANRNGVYEARGNRFDLTIDKKGNITKVTHTSILGYSDGKPVTDKVSTIFKYNEHGDIEQQIYDLNDDGKYEYVYNFDCMYDENDNLISHKETGFSIFKNACKRFFGIEERERGAKGPSIPVK